MYWREQTPFCVFVEYEGQDIKDAYVDFECPHCVIDIDFEDEERAPDPGTEYECPNCYEACLVAYAVQSS